MFSSAAAPAAALALALALAAAAAFPKYRATNTSTLKYKILGML
jgi:hypothetical protein